jgi:uncharacterized protein YcbK (DUF882 family)
MVTEKKSQPIFSRRSFLQKTTQIVAGLGVASVPAISNAKALGKRSLSFYHTHTLQSLDITYAWGRVYSPRALAQIEYYLRDFRTGETHPIDPKLLDILWTIQGEMGRKGVYEVISGYRSPTTNRQLRKNSSGVAGKSLHMRGKAIDVRFSGIDTDQIQQCAIEMRAGGVGYYAKSDFVHLDTGEYRTW